MYKEFSHEPEGYQCPFCLIASGGSDEYASPDDIVYQTRLVTGKISPKWWINNPGHVIVVPNEHYENLYDIPDETLAAVYAAVKEVAIAMRSTYGCDGISTRQHNEPAGDQSVWHLHVHVFPRYAGDGLYENHAQRRYVGRDERAEYVKKIRGYFTRGR